MLMDTRSVVVPRYTVEEIESWPDDGNRYELLDGILLVTPSPGPIHQLVAAELVRILGAFLDPWPWCVISAPGVIIRPPKTELQPDLLVFRKPPGRFKWEAVQEHLLAVEIMSRSTRIYDRDFKRPAYLALGVEEVWRVNPDERVVFVSRTGGPPDRPHRDHILWSPAALGRQFTVSLDRIFRGID